MFGSALSTNLRVAGGLALDPNNNTPNGVRKSGAVEPLRVAADLRIHDREELALRRAMVNIDEESLWRELETGDNDVLFGKLQRTRSLVSRKRHGDEHSKASNPSGKWLRYGVSRSGYGSWAIRRRF